MIGTSWMRMQGLEDQLLLDVMRSHGVSDLGFGLRGSSATRVHMQRWITLTKLRDGPVNPERTTVNDSEAMSAEIKRRAKALGADLVGIAPLEPDMIELGAELPHDFVIALLCREDYSKILDGAEAVHIEAMRIYARCAEISTELARQVREELGYPALPHHNGACQIQAIPAMYHAGLGELGKHGSLINPELGANFRPGFVTTTLPLAPDETIKFGVQDYCLNCSLCTNNCPGDAIAQEYIVTDGVRRWLVDIEKCYPVSRLRKEYCHICVDVCPYIHKENGNTAVREIYKDYMNQRREAGYKTPKEDGTAKDMSTEK